MIISLRLKTRIVLGFSLITILTFATGIVGYITFNRVNKQFEVSEAAHIIKEKCLETRRQEKNYIMRQEEYYEKWEDAVAELKTVLVKEQKVTRQAEIRNRLGAAKKELEQYEAFFYQYHNLMVEGKNLDDQMRESARDIENYLKKMKRSDPALTALLHARRQEKNLILYRYRVLKKGEKSYFSKWQDEMTKLNNRSGVDKSLKNLTARYEGFVLQRVRGLKQMDVVDGNMLSSVRAVTKIIDRISDKSKSTMHAVQNRAKMLIMVILGIYILITVLLAFFIIRAITKSLVTVKLGAPEQQ